MGSCIFPAMVLGDPAKPGHQIKPGKFHAPLPKMCNNGNSSVICVVSAVALPEGDYPMKQTSFWRYRKHKELDFFPQGKLRWWLLGLIVLGWAVEQYEALKNGPVLVYILEDFDKTLVEWGYVAAFAGLVYSIGAMLLSRATDRFGRRPLMIWPVFAYAMISVVGAVTPNFWTLAFLVAAGSFLMAV